MISAPCVMGKIGYHQIPFRSGCACITCTKIHWSMAQTAGMAPRINPHRFLKNKSAMLSASITAVVMVATPPTAPSIAREPGISRTSLWTKRMNNVAISA